ncbi:Centrosomal protein [Nymphon striatum]|nr:Centrosomal protein [Nymphon striatum]
MKALNERVEQWKAVILEKDEQIFSHIALVNELQEKITALSADTNSTSIAVLSKALQERDQQINMLKEQLEMASKDIDDNVKMINTLKDDLFSENGMGLDQHNRFAELERELRETKVKYNQVEKQMLEAEEDAMKRDKELSDVITRMHQYETGEYGLSEAVAEIKDYKTQIKIRDRQIEELTQIANRSELQLNEFMEENEDLCERLGLDPKSPTKWSSLNGEGISRYNTKIQKDRALIHTLQQENAKLEDERIEMKLKIRKLAQMAGERAGAIGLSAQDLQTIQDFTTDLKNRNKLESASEKVKLNVQNEEIKYQTNQLEKDLMDSHKEMDVIKSSNRDLQCKVSELEKENKKLESGLREILSSLQDQNGQTDITVKCPTLEKLLSVMETKSPSGNFDHNEYLKSQLNMYMGRCEQLRIELKDFRQENNTLASQVERYKLQVESLENQLKLVENSIGSQVQSTTLLDFPEKISKTSSNVISNLNTHLIQALHELTAERKTITELEEKLEDNNKKFAVIKHQLGLLYEQYHTERQEWEDHKQSLNDEQSKIKASKEEGAIRLAEYDRLLENLDQDENELKRRVADVSRRITKLHVSDATLNRKCNLYKETESMLRRQNNKFKNEIVVMENTFTERFGAFSRFKDMVNFKMAALQKSLEDSIPISELQKANREYEVLTAKYRDLLEHENKLVVRSESSQQNEVEVQRLEKDNGFLKSELETQKEKVHNFEALFADLNKQGYSTSTDITEVQPLSKRLATVEMKELNERQRADHAQHLYEQQRALLQSLEKRNEELEVKFKELTKINLDQQQSEKDLRDQLAHCVSAEINSKNEEKIEVLEKDKFKLTQEVSKLKEISDIARNQAEMVEISNKLQQKEVITLQNQLLELQSETDEKTIIGKLYRQVLTLQLGEGLAVSKLDKSLTKIAKMEEACLKLEQISDEKNQQIYHIRRQGMSKVHFLNKIIHELRYQFCGAIPISKQEKFSQEMIKLQDDRIAAECALNEARNRQIQVEDKLAELELRHKGLEELMDTLKSGKSAQRMSEWHDKLENLRVLELKNKRTIDRLNKKVEHLESIIFLQEKKFEQMESDAIAKTREIEERELFWENRETEHELRIVNVDEQQISFKKDTPPKLQEKLSSPITKTSPIQDSISRELQQNLNIANNKIQNMREELKTKDKKIRNLKLKFAQDISVDVLPSDEISTSQSTALAKTTISSLKKRLELKEENIQKYEEMLKQANRDYEEQTKHHEHELLQLNENLRQKRESHLDNFRDVIKQMTDTINEQDSFKSGLSNKQLARLNELEDIVSEQENAMSTLADKLQQARGEINLWKQKLNDFKNEMEQKLTNLKEIHMNELTDMEKSVFAKGKDIEAKLMEIDGLHKELESQTVHSTQVPSNALKSMVERLKRQLNEKEKQLQSLSRALSELRSEMVSIAQQNLTSQQIESDQMNNVQNIIKQKTDVLQRKIGDLESERELYITKSASDENEKKKLVSEIELLKEEIKHLKINISTEKEMNSHLGSKGVIQEVPTNV